MSIKNVNVDLNVPAAGNADDLLTPASTNAMKITDTHDAVDPIAAAPVNIADAVALVKKSSSRQEDEGEETALERKKSTVLAADTTLNKLMAEGFAAERKRAGGLVWIV